MSGCVTVIALLAFVAWELHAATPFVDVRSLAADNAMTLNFSACDAHHAWRLCGHVRLAPVVGGCLPYERRCFRHVHHSDGGGGDSGFVIHREEADSAPAVDGVLFGDGGGGHVVGLHVIRWHGRIAVDRLAVAGLVLGLSMSTSQTVLYRRAASEHIARRLVCCARPSISGLSVRPH